MACLVQVGYFACRAETLWARRSLHSWLVLCRYASFFKSDHRGKQGMTGWERLLARGGVEGPFCSTGAGWQYVIQGRALHVYLGLLFCLWVILVVGVLWLVFRMHVEGETGRVSTACLDACLRLFISKGSAVAIFSRLEDGREVRCSSS